MRFSYQYYSTATTVTTPTGVLHRPEIPIKIIGDQGEAELFALVDPGADETLLPRSTGILVGADFDDTQTWHTEGIGGHRLVVNPANVILELTDGRETFRWAAIIGFVSFADPSDEAAVLGHAGFLDYFRVTFDGHLRELEIEVSPSFPGVLF